MPKCSLATLLLSELEIQNRKLNIALNWQKKKGIQQKQSLQSAARRMFCVVLLYFFLSSQLSWRNYFFIPLLAWGISNPASITNFKQDCHAVHLRFIGTVVIEIRQSSI